jgi:arginase family enzyme
MDEERLRDKKIYISIDIDVLDPVMRQIGNPEPEGISPTLPADMLNDVVDDRSSDLIC